MTLIRAHARIGAGLALLALALQLGLSFGHFHAMHTALRAAVLVAGGDQASTGAHPHPAPDGLSPDDCDICASIALARTAMHAVAPVLPVLVVFATVATQPPHRAPTTRTRHVAFNPRAPPFA
jgi:hypothetical protein